jgi:tetratricopeptide (TPR) repeat protein
MFLYHSSGMSLETGDKLSLVDSAVKHLKISIKDNDMFYDSLFLMGMILSDKKEYKESNDCLGKAALLQKTPSLYYQMAFNYGQLKDEEKEIGSYKQILDLNPYDFKALSAVSQYHLKRNEHKEASEYLEKLFLKYPGSLKISLDYLYSLFAAREVDKFLEVSDTIDLSDSPYLTFARAFFLSQKGRIADGIKLLNRMEKKSVQARLLLANLYKKKKDYHQAYRTLKTIREDEKNFFYYSLHIDVLSMMNMNRRILDTFEQVKKDEDLLGQLSLMDYYNAIFAHVKLNTIDPVLDLARLAKSKLKEDADSELLADLIRTLEVLAATGDIDAEQIIFDLNGYLIINLFKRQKQYDKAVSLLKDMIKKEEGKNPGPYMELCDIYIERKNSENAERLLKKMKQLFPSSVEIKNFYAYFMALENKNLEYALKLSKYTLTKDADSPAYLDTYGYILFRMGRIDEAVTYLEKAYQKHPFEPEIMEHLVECYRLKKNTQKIIEIYQLAVDNGVDFKDQLVEKLKKLKEELRKTTD